MEASIEVVESLHLLWDWKLPRMLPVESSMEASSGTSAEASKELRSLPRISTWFHFHLRPLRPMQFDVLALLPLAFMRFRVVTFFMPCFSLP